MHEFGERVFHVLPRQVDQTVAAALREWLPGVSWSRIKKLIAGRYVQVSGNLCLDPARRLKLQDVVKILPRPAQAPPTPHDVTVIYLDEHLVVVDKPPGMTTNRHRDELRASARRRQLQPTLDEVLPHIIAKIEGKKKRYKGVPPPVRAVHRLDRETSGLIVFARTGEAERGLMEQFRKHTTERKYLAIIHGYLPAQTIKSYLVRDRGDGRRGSTKNPNEGRIAITHVRPVERIGNYTLVECRLETGRTHQIRIHLAEAGHPVCGEKIYNRPLFGEPIPDHSGAPRLALAAVELGFIHPITKQPMKFEIPLPKDLTDFLHELRRRARQEKSSRTESKEPPSA
jgi:23S rRNA pseudouridine1911/1915/1917 synthase